MVDIMSDSKKCTKCKKLLPLSNFHFDKSRPDGHCYICVYCRCPGHAENEKKREAKLAPTRFCTMCGIEKLREEFGNDKRVIGGRKVRCRACYAKLMLAERKAHPEKARELSRKFNRLHRDIRCNYNHRYHSEHKEEESERSRKYRHENLESVYERNRNRRARELSAPGDGVTRHQWAHIVSLFGSKCLYPGCGSTKVSMDHIVPLILGGAHDTYNIQPLCRSHNSGKHTKIVDYRFVVDWT